MRELSKLADGQVLFHGKRERHRRREGAGESPSTLATCRGSTFTIETGVQGGAGGLVASKLRIGTNRGTN